MVEINNQRKAFLDMLAWSETMADVRKPEIMVNRRHCRPESYLLITPITLAACHAKPTQINRRPTLPADFFPVGGMHRKRKRLKDFSEKSGRCGEILAVKERGALPYD